MASETQPKVMSIDVAFPATLRQKKSCRSTTRKRMGGNRSTSILSGINVMRQTIMTSTIKVVLGFLELAFALKFLSVADLAYGWHILDRETFLALWIVIFSLLGCYLLGLIKFPHDDETERRTTVPKFFIALCSLAFAIYMIPGLWGAPCKAVSAFAPPLYTQDFNLNEHNTVEPKFKDYEKGMAYAKQMGLPVMVDFTGFGCVNCRKMEMAVWPDKDVTSPS